MFQIHTTIQFVIKVNEKHETQISECLFNYIIISIYNWIDFIAMYFHRKHNKVQQCEKCSFLSKFIITWNYLYFVNTRKIY